MHEILTKKAFAELTGVTPSCVSHWISDKKLAGPALVGTGCRARIRVAAALEQLRRGLDIDQRLGSNARARLGGAGAHAMNPAAGMVDTPDGEGLSAGFPRATTPPAGDEAEETLEERIKVQRLAQLSLANSKAREEAAVRSGAYVKADEARREIGRMASRLLTMFDASLNDFANCLAGQPAATPRDALRTLRATWRDIRARQAKAVRTEAYALPPLVAEEEEEER